ncbi:MAG: SDR family NAD(P)-dependent oxidoreductase [Solirubrobacteraceae bacterium]
MRDGLGGVQSALVLGGGSEIGLAIARELVGDRTRTVVLAARRPDALDGAVADLRAAGASTVEAVRFEARDVAAHESVIADVFERHGDIDVVVVAFGLLGAGAAQAAAEGRAGPALDVLEVNCTGAISAMVAATGLLRRQGHGTLVVLSSVAAVRARADNFPYAASKAGLDAFAEGLGDALEGTGVSVLVVRPGFVHTRMTAGRKAAPLATSPEATAALVVSGLRQGRHSVWAPGATRWLMGAIRLLPRAAYRRVARRAQ